MLNKITRPVLRYPSFDLILFILGVVLILFYSFRVGVFKNPDEGAHYLRAYEVANGHLWNGKNDIGININCNDYVVIAKKYAPIAYYQDTAERGGEGCYVKTINSASTYPPTAYLMLALAIKIGGLFDLTVEDNVILCRILNGVFCFFLIFFATNNIPFARYSILAVLFSPMLMVMLSAVSADSVTIALVFSFFSCFLYARYSDVFTKRHFYLVLILSLLIGLTKIIYCVLCFSYVSVFINKYGVTINRNNYKEFIIALTPGLVALIASILGVLHSDRSMIYLGNGAQPSIQINYVLHNPILFLKIVLGVITNSSILTQLFVPVHLLQPETYLWSLISISVSVFWAGLLVVQQQKIVFYSRCYIFILLAISLCLVVLPLYLTYTPPGYSSVLGVQGRYFLPIILLIPFLFSIKYNIGNDVFLKVNRVLLGGVCFANFFVVYKVCF